MATRWFSSLFRDVIALLVPHLHHLRTFFSLEKFLPFTDGLSHQPNSVDSDQITHRLLTAMLRKPNYRRSSAVITAVSLIPSDSFPIIQLFHLRL